MAMIRRLAEVSRNQFQEVIQGGEKGVETMN